MDIMTIFWIFFMLSALQPVLRQKLLESARQKLIASIEKKRGSRVILLVYRQETMSLLGFPVFRYISIEDSEEVIRAISMTDPDMPIDLILHTPGGLVLASYQIAHAIKGRPGKVTVHVPHYAMSGGTLIALAANQIVMGDHAVLGPVDPQIDEYPASSLVKLVQTKPASEIDDRTWLLADIGKKAIDQLRDQVTALLADNFPKEKADELAVKLSEGRWTPDFPITFEVAKDLGLPVNKGVPDELYQLMSLYPQPVKRLPTVKYLPYPKFKEPKEKL
ncbi:MAG: SDH family Clp fold serine proteinase [Betaproteobacteria bacterium]